MPEVVARLPPRQVIEDRPTPSGAGSPWAVLALVAAVAVLAILTKKGLSIFPSRAWTVYFRRRHWNRARWPALPPVTGVGQCFSGRRLSCSNMWFYMRIEVVQ